MTAAFEGGDETARVTREVLHGETFRYLLVVVGWDHWSIETELELPRRFTKQSIGELFYLYGKLPANTVWARPFEFGGGLGGNVDPSRLLATMPLRPLGNGRGFLGAASRTGEIEISAPSNRASAEAVLLRLSPAGGPTEKIRFRAYAKDQEKRYLRWSEDLALPEGADELIVPTGRLDASGMPLLFTMEIPDAMAGKLAAGWRALTLWDSIDRGERPPLLQAGAALVKLANGELRAVLQKEALAGAPVIVRNSWLEDGVCRISPGGEVWIHLSGLYSKIELSAKSPASSGENPKVRVVYYKGGRLETFHPAPTTTPGGGSIQCVVARK